MTNIDISQWKLSCCGGRKPPLRCTYAHLADRFQAIIKTAYKQTGLQVTILIDEYNAPLQHSWNTPEHERCTDVYREVFAILKADDEYEQLVFITGNTRLSVWKLNWMKKAKE